MLLWRASWTTARCREEASASVPTEVCTGMVGHSAHASFRVHVPWCTHDQNVTYTEGGCLEGCDLLEGVVRISTKLSGEVAQ